MKSKKGMIQGKDIKYEINGEPVSEKVFYKSIAAEIKARNKPKKKKKKS